MKGSSTSAPPDRASLRRLLLAVLPTDPESDAFCLDYFPDTKQKFAGSMDRVQKLNLLLEREDAQEIVRALKKHDPKRYTRSLQQLAEGETEVKAPVLTAPSAAPPRADSSPAQPTSPPLVGSLSSARDTTITILHVSDMQFGRNHRFGRGADEPFDTLLRRLTDDLDQHHKLQGLKPDVVALTGDLAEWGQKTEYEDVYKFCVGLQEHLKLSRDRILVIPGNHDVNRKLCEGYFAQCDGREKKPVAPYWPKWKPYVEFFRRLYKDVKRYEFTNTVPYTWFELPELKIVVAGLNSTMRESHKEKDPKDPASIFGHYGHVGEAQLHWFKKRLEEAESKGWLRVGLVHHNALRGATDDDENLRDAQLLVDRIGSKLNLLLHGHTHNGSLGFLDHDLPVISTGSAAVKAEQRPEEVPNQYQIIQVRRDGFTTWAQQYTPALRKWIADPRIAKNGREGFHHQRLDLPNTHATFVPSETEIGPPESSPVTATIEVTVTSAPPPRIVPAEKPPKNKNSDGRSTSSATLDKLRRELRKLLQDAPSLTAALLSAGFGDSESIGQKQAESVCEALLNRRIAEVAASLVKLAREPEHGSLALQILCLVLPLATDLESVVAPTTASSSEAGAMVLPLRTSTFAEVAMARLDGRRAEFIPGRLYLQGLRRILMPTVAYTSLVDPDGRELEKALVQSLQAECQIAGTRLPDAAGWRSILAEHPSDEAFRKGVRDQIGADADVGESRYLLFIDDELDREGHLKGDNAMDDLWQMVRDKLPRVIPGLRVVRLTVRMTDQSPPAVEDETKIARILGKALPSQ